MPVLALGVKDNACTGTGSQRHCLYWHWESKTLPVLALGDKDIACTAAQWHCLYCHTMTLPVLALGDNDSACTGTGRQ